MIGLHFPFLVWDKEECNMCCSLSKKLASALLALIVCLPLCGSATTLLFDPDKLVIRLEPGQSIDAINEQFETSVDEYLPQLDIYLLKCSTSQDMDALANTIEELPEVSFCHPNYRVDPLEPVQGSLPITDLTGTGDYWDQPAVDILNLDGAHSLATGSGVTMAVLDGGINYTHSQLSGFVTSGYDYVDNDENAFDEIGGANSGHGTFVAGVVHLVAPDADIRSYRVTDINGESNGYMVAEAILQAVDDGCRVINLSMVTMAVHNAINEAIEYAKENNVITVVAAGNTSGDSACYPASDVNALAVAAVDTMGYLADFSSYGDHVDVCAPGVDIYSPYQNDDYAWWGGTSFAAPFVTAEATLITSLAPELTWDQVTNAIIGTATNIDSENPAYVGKLGSGVINPWGSLQSTSGSSCGDLNGDGILNIIDFVTISTYLSSNDPVPDPLWVADVDGVPGITNNDCQTLIGVVFNSGPLPSCTPVPDTTFPASLDFAEVRNYTADPYVTQLTVELWLDAVDTYRGFSFPFTFGCATSNVTLDSITFDTPAGITKDAIDNTNSSGLILANNLTEPLPAGEQKIASLHFTLSTPQSYSQTIAIQTGTYPPSNSLVLSRMDQYGVATGVKPAFMAFDTDGDGIANDNDNCPFVYNPGQEDSDADGIGNVCDNCPAIANPYQEDADEDGAGDICDPCPNDPLDDGDGDGLCADADNCPADYNPGQEDADSDGVGDVCDACPGDPDNDPDNDGICSGNDNCPSVANPGQEDVDGDGTGDVCDNCPSIANADQQDSDNDGHGDLCDICWGYDDFLDTDSDGFPDGCDNCADVYNPGQEDSDGNGYGDACEGSGVCGDVNGQSGAVSNIDITDMVYLLIYLYQDGLPPANLWTADVDGIYGITNNDVTTWIAGFFGTNPGWECQTVTDSTFPISNDTLEILGTQVPAGESERRIDLWLSSADTVIGIAFPFSFSSATSELTLDSIVDYSNADIKGINPISNSNGSALFGNAWLNGGLPDGRHMFASLYFSLTASTETQEIVIDTTMYQPSNTTVVSRRGAGATTIGSIPRLVSVPENYDGDTDGIINSADNCYAVPNPDQNDQDQDGIGDACDVCPDVNNPDQLDSDGDTYGDICDNCPDEYNPDQLDADGNGIGDVCELMCGDANSDRIINVSDAVFIVNYIFKGGAAPTRLEAGDANCNGLLNIGDAVYIVNYIFKGGPAPCCP